MNVIMTILQFMPFIFLLWIANLSEHFKGHPVHHRSSTGLAIIGYAFLCLLYGAMLLFGILIQLLSLTAPMDQIGSEAGLEGEFVIALMNLGPTFWMTALLGLILLIPPVRRGLAKWIPIQPDNRIHTFVLSASMLIWWYFFLFMAIGLELLANMIPAEENPMPELWAQQITFFFMALVGVGWLSWRRTFKESLNRLGLVKPTLKQCLIGIGFGLFFVGVAQIIEVLFQIFGIVNDPHVETLTENMLGGLFGSVGGILTLGLSAALGEEAIFRGALQPRFGLLLTAVLFTVVHSNYGFSVSTLVVFLLALALGVLRNRYNTSTTMIVHATYNMTLGILYAFFG